jgi:uncharacterized protein YoxC
MAFIVALTRAVSWPLLQTVTLPDTIIARTIPDRGVLEWTSGLLEILVLLLAVGALASLILLLGAMREGVKKLNGTLDRLTNDTQPMLANARAIVEDARDMVATVKRDVGTVSSAAAAMGDTILDAADVTAQRIDEVNAVLDVVQEELEETAITAISAVRGVRLGAREMLAHLPRRGRKKRRRGSPQERDDQPENDRVP